jgi:hypothetical protein
MVPAVAPASQRFIGFPEPPAGVPVDDRIDRLYYLSVMVQAFRYHVIGRLGQADTTTTALYGQTVLGNQIRYDFALFERP